MMGFRSDILSKSLYLRVKDQSWKRRDIVLKNMYMMNRKWEDK